MEKKTRNCKVLFVRHGERLDEVKKGEKAPKVEFSFDPPLTENGKTNLAFTAGAKIKEYLEASGHGASPIKFISSPFIRCL